MDIFEIKENFMLNNKPFKILSGAIHYFRVHPDSWYHSLYNLKALGFNTVETYVPWNMHEKHKGDFDFSGILNIEKFLTIAKELGLYAIVRPSPFICAEWEFGGLPAWLLKEQVKVRTDDKTYLAHVEDYYKVLLPKLKKYQLSYGGNILMFQVENEYGSYGEDKAYLKALKEMMCRFGINMPLFTSDGPWYKTMRAGSLIEEDVLVTGNFGSKAKYNFEKMQQFFDEHHKKWPLMCMEFWDGWFNRWKEPIIKRDAKELAQSIKEALEIGSINLYMFHGGTNFGFMNGCSARHHLDLPQVTSYDYDAILNEQGNPTEKFYEIQNMLKKDFAYLNLEFKEPLYKSKMEMTNIPLKNSISLFDSLDQLSIPIHSKYPKNMEMLDQNVGYILYRSTVEKDIDESEIIRIVDARDRMQLFIDENYVTTQYQWDIGEKINYPFTNNPTQLDVLIENMGRVNYGEKLDATTQVKGIGRGVMVDLHYITQFDQYCLPLTNVSNLDFSKEYNTLKEKVPAFHLYEFEVEKPEDTYINMSQFGKGVVFINSVNIGRFWNVGPTLSLYIPKGYIKEGKNSIIVFETEGIYSQTINLEKNPIFIELEGENL